MRRSAISMFLFGLVLAGMAERAWPGTVSGRREGQFGEGVHESWVWLTGVGANTTDARALGMTWLGDFTIKNVKAGQYWAAADEYGAYPHNVGPMITVSSSGAVNLQFRDHNTMDSVGLTDLGSAVWAAQTFVATGRDVALATVVSPSDGAEVRVSIRENGPDGRQVGPDRTVVIGSNGPLSPVLARWAPGQVPTILCRRYALRLDLVSGRSWRPGVSYRANQYPNGHAWIDGEPIAEADLAVTVTSRDSGFVDDYRVDNWWRSETFRELLQTFVPSGQELRIAQMMPVGVTGALMRASVHEWNGSYPPGQQVGVAKHAEMAAGLLQGFVWGPGEAPLTPGRQYAIRFVRADGQPFAIYGDSDEYGQGQAYFDGIPDGGIDVTGRLVTKEIDRGQIVLSNTSFTPISATEVRVAFNTDLRTAGTVVCEIGKPAFETILPDEAPAGKSHNVIVRHLKPATAYRMSILAYNPLRNVLRTAAVSVTTLNEFAPSGGHVHSQVGPVTGAKVILEEAGLTTVTNGLGDFSFASVTTGRHTLRVEAADCGTVTQEAEVTRDGLTRANVTTSVYASRLAVSDSDPITGWTKYGNFDGQYRSGQWGVYARTGSKWVGSVGNCSPKTGGIYRTVPTEKGHEYLFSGYVLTDAHGSDHDPVCGLAVARLGVDPAGGTDPAGPNVIWGRYRFTAHEWQEIPVTFTAAGPQATLFAEHKWEDYYELPPWYIAGFDDLWLGEKRRAIPDFDHDGDVDLEDFGHLQACFAGADVPQPPPNPPPNPGTCLVACSSVPDVPQDGPACEDARLDLDADVDGADLEVFQNCLSGANVAYDPACAD